MSKNICIKEGVYRYDIDGTILLYDRENGLSILNDKLESVEEVIGALNEIIKYEFNSKKTT